MTLRFETRVLDFPKDDASEGPRLCVLLAHKCSRHVTHGSGLKPNHSGWLGKPGQDVAMRYSQLRWFGSDGPQEILRTTFGTTDGHGVFLRSYTVLVPIFVGTQKGSTCSWLILQVSIFIEYI